MIIKKNLFSCKDATEDKLNTLTSDQILQILELKNRDILSPDPL